MIGYATIGISDMGRAQAFYDPLIELLGGHRLHVDDRFTFYGSAPQAMLAICTPYDGNAPSAGNGAMIALKAPSRAAVDSAHAKAMELGAGCEGEPGLREPLEMQFYGAYFRDPDGNKLCVYTMGMDG